MSMYLNNKRRHKTSDVELIIVQPLKKPLSIGNAATPYIVFNICHEIWGKHELRRVHRNLLFILTHQLASHHLRQI